MPWSQGEVSFRVEIGLGATGAGSSIWDTAEWETGVWGDTEINWVVVSSDVLAASTSRGRDRWGERVRTSTAQIVFANDTGRYNPESGVPGIGGLTLRPGRRIRFSGNAGAGWIPLFTGVIDALEESYAPGGENIITTMLAYGYAGLLANENPPALGSAVGAGDLTSERVDRVLDAFGWPDETGDRSIQTGIHTMPSTTLARSRLEEIQRAATAEGTVFFFDGDGIPTFKALGWLNTDTRSITTQIYPGRGNAGDPEIIGVRTEWSAQLIRNDVQYTRVGGSMVRVQDYASQALYGAVFSEVVTDLELQTDAQVTTLADRFLAARAYDQLRLRELELHAADGDTAEALLELELGDLVEATVETLHGWDYTVEAHVMGIDYRVTADDWVLRLRLDPDLASTAYWVLEDATLGVLGSTTRLRGY